jgi:hypothetical protein
MLIEVDTLFGDPRKRAARGLRLVALRFTPCFSLGTGLSLIETRTVGLIN